MSYYTRCSHASVHQTNQTIHQNGDEDGKVVAQSIIPFDMLVLNAAGYYGHTELRRWQMEYCDQEATLNHSFGPQPQTPDFQHPVQELSDMLQSSCHIGPQPPPSDPTYPAYSDETPVSTLRYLLENPTLWQGLVPRSCDVDVGFTRFSNWPQTHLNHVDRIDQQFQDLSITTHDQRSIGPQAQTPVPEASPTCLDNWGSVFTPYEIGLFEGTTPAQVPSLLASDDVRLNGYMPYQWSQTHLDHIDHVDPQLKDLSTMLHGSCSIGPQPQIQISMPEAHPTCLDDMGSFFTPRELGMLEGATPTSQMPPRLVSDVDARLNGMYLEASREPWIDLSAGCMPWSQTHPNHVDRIDPQFDENPWGSQQIAHHSTANYAPPTRVVAGIKHGTVIEQTSYQVRGQRRRSGQPLLRVDFYRSNGRRGIGLSQPKDLRDDKAEVSFVGGKGQKMSYRIRISSNVVLPEEGKQWKFGGDDGITLENLVLLSVEQVSVGSLQPSLMYVDPSQPW
ncbi:hypothetical protein PHLCEN_2v8169 [Hermanssonia centrifuga]|uniref:Uncharacterized protein n=1 Tax=Hermanssonia centrifuga TaxID=98765 RepID=A0A2R6NUB5_9APHY|nr:hypothetical protein PHLCEN_2v8169 [Hermanssonia centrifuga]